MIIFSFSLFQQQAMYNKYLDVNNYGDLYRSPSMKSTGSNILHLTSNLRASMRSKLSHASHLLLYGEEGRAAKVTILVVLSIGKRKFWFKISPPDGAHSEPRILFVWPIVDVLKIVIQYHNLNQKSYTFFAKVCIF